MQPNWSTDIKLYWHFIRSSILKEKPKSPNFQSNSRESTSSDSKYFAVAIFKLHLFCCDVSVNLTF